MCPRLPHICHPHRHWCLGQVGTRVPTSFVIIVLSCATPTAFACLSYTKPHEVRTLRQKQQVSFSFSKGAKNSKHLAVLPVELFSRISFCCQTMAFQAGLLSSKDESPRCAYQEGQPFPHMVIQGVMQHDFLRQVRSEISRNLDSSSMKTRCTA